MPELDPAPQKGHRERVTELFSVSDIGPADSEGDYRIRFVTHGLTSDGKRYYPKRASEQAVRDKVYDNAKMYLNHTSPADNARGHRDVRDWAATIKPGSVRATEDGLEAVAHAHLPAARAFLDDPVAKAAVGLSHDTYVKVSKSRINGADVQVVESIDSCLSVDFVPSGNAYGRVLETATDEELIDEMELTQVQEKLDSLAGAVDTLTSEVKRITEAQAAQAAPPAPPAEDTKPENETPQVDVDARVQEAVNAATAAQSERIKVLEDEKAANTCLALVREAVDARTDLTEISKARVVQTFAGQIIAPDQIVARVTEACDRERQYALDLLTEAGVRTQVKGIGATNSGEMTRAVESYNENLRASMVAQGYSQQEIEKLLAAR